MARYKKYEHLPWWLNNLNDNTLRPTEKEALDTDYYCLPHGTKLSHQRAADMHHRSKRAVQLARRRLEELRLRTSEPAKGSCRIGHPIEYQNEDEWLAALRAQDIDPRGAMIAPRSSRGGTPLRGFPPLEGKNVATAETAEAGVSSPQTPAGLTDRCSGEAGESPTIRQAKTEGLRKLVYKDKLRKIIEAGYPEDQAKNLARIGTNHYIAKRKAERKSREEKRTEDQRNENPNSD